MTILFAKIIILIFTQYIIRTYIGSRNRIYGDNLARIKSGQTRLRSVLDFKKQNVSDSTTETSGGITNEKLFGAKINTPKKIDEDVDENKSINTCKPAKNKLWKKLTGAVKDKACSVCTSVKKYTSYARGKLSDWRQILCAEIGERSERIPTKRTLGKAKHILSSCKTNKEVIIKDVINTIKTIGRLCTDTVISANSDVHVIFGSVGKRINLRGANIKRNLQARIIGLRPEGTPREGIEEFEGSTFVKKHHKIHYFARKFAHAPVTASSKPTISYFSKPYAKRDRLVSCENFLVTNYGLPLGVRLRFAAGFAFASLRGSCVALRAPLAGGFRPERRATPAGYG